MVRSSWEVFERYWVAVAVAEGEEGEEGEEEEKLYIDEETEGGAIQIHFFPTTCAVLTSSAPTRKRESERRTKTIEIRIRMSRRDRSARSKPSIHNVSLLMTRRYIAFESRFRSGIDVIGNLDVF